MRCGRIYCLECGHLLPTPEELAQGYCNACLERLLAEAALSDRNFEQESCLA